MNSITFLFIIFYYIFIINTNLCLCDPDSGHNSLIKINNLDFCNVIDNEFPADINSLLYYNFSDFEINNYGKFLLELKNKENFFITEQLKKPLNYNDPFIVNLGVDSDVIENLKNEMIKAYKYAKKLGSYIEETLVPTSHFDTKFSLIPFMLPSLPKFLRQASKNILNNIPEFKKMYIHAFLVEPGAISENTHNQGNHRILNNFKVFDEKIWPNVVNVHIALNDLSEKKQPFIFYPNTNKEIVTPRYAYKVLMDAGLISINEKLIYEKALFLAENAWDYENFQVTERIHSGAFFLLKKYYQYAYCTDSREIKAQAFWGNVTKGSALIFSPFMLHGGGIFPPGEEYRFSLVLRTCDKDNCFPWTQKMDEDRGIILNTLYWAYNTYKKLKMYNKMNECYKNIFNYDDSSKIDLLAIRALPMDMDKIITSLEEHYKQENTIKWIKNDDPEISSKTLICIQQFYRDSLGKEIEIKINNIKNDGNKNEKENKKKEKEL